MSQYCSLCLGGSTQVCVVYLLRTHICGMSARARLLGHLIGRHLFPRANWLNVPEITTLAFSLSPSTSSSSTLYLIYLCVCLFICSFHRSTEKCKTAVWALFPPVIACLRFVYSASGVSASVCDSRLRSAKGRLCHTLAQRR